MGGFLGLGQSGQERQSNNNLNNVFSYGLGESQGQQKAGKSSLGDAESYFRQLLAPGRTTAALNAAPVANAIQDKADTARLEEAATGTSRGGGTAEANRQASATEAKTLDDALNENLVGGRKAAASGLSQTGATELQNASQLLGLGSDSSKSTLSGALNKEDAQTAAFTKLISAFL